MRIHVLRANVQDEHIQVWKGYIMRVPLEHCVKNVRLPPCLPKMEDIHHPPIHF
jgi:hypothetical protein